MVPFGSIPFGGMVPFGGAVQIVHYYCEHKVNI